MRNGAAPESVRAAGRGGGRLALLLVLLAPAAGCPADRAGDVPLVRGEVHDVLERLEPLVAPGPLAEGHRGVAELERCEACHELSGPIPDDKCLACHEEIGRRRAARAGYHGTALEGRCASCHEDHDGPLVSFDRQEFNHDRALFALAGRHRGLDCEQCHLRPEEGRFAFLGLEHDRCDACHEDPHRGTLADRSCDACHDVSGFEEAARRFDHATSGFALDALHRRLECRACHDEAPLYEPLPRDCAACHEDAARALGGRVTIGNVARTGPSSPHEGLVSCDACHDPQGGDESALAHASRCAGCHQPRYAALFLERAALVAEARARRPEDARVQAAARVFAHDFPLAAELLREAGMLGGR